RRSALSFSLERPAPAGRLASEIEPLRQRTHDAVVLVSVVVDVGEGAGVFEPDADADVAQRPRRRIPSGQGRERNAEDRAYAQDVVLALGAVDVGIGAVIEVALPAHAGEEEHAAVEEPPV